MAKGLLSGQFWNQVSDTIYERHQERVAQLVDMFLADGYPPFHQPLTPREEMQQLQMLRASDSGYYWDSDTAKTRLAQLEARYGPGAV